MMFFRIFFKVGVEYLRLIGNKNMIERSDFTKGDQFLKVGINYNKVGRYLTSIIFLKKEIVEFFNIKDYIYKAKLNS